MLLKGEKIPVNSAHHQAIKNLGDGFEAIATSSDGTIIEAIRHKEAPIIGVQWHPERMCFAKKREDTIDGKEIIKCFLDCANNFDLTMVAQCGKLIEKSGNFIF